ncbi:MAG TPA: pyruvate kinase alpha/beta domain-containing protein [Ferrovibrio sp.]|uniref:pyruvate kinase alpha/beta domain-containing protein n=1 Tax=Ferrovibrio sp. TaxID=1917215 RepID=UPI002ED06AA1
MIVAFTSSGTTAPRIARKRPAVPILAITPEAVSRRLCLLIVVAAGIPFGQSGTTNNLRVVQV